MRPPAAPTVAGVRSNARSNDQRSSRIGAVLATVPGGSATTIENGLYAGRFRCAKTAPHEIHQRIVDASILTYIEMGRERFVEARQVLAQGLALDPKNRELLELQQLIEQSMKRP